MEVSIQKIKKCCNEQELEALARLLELHIKLTDGDGLDDDEDLEYQECINQVGAVLPVLY